MGATKHDPRSKHSLHGVASSCQSLLIRNQEKIDKRRACTCCTLTSQVEKLRHEEEGHPLQIIQPSSSTSHAPIAPHTGLQSLNSLLLYFYKFELIHNAYI